MILFAVHPLATLNAVLNSLAAVLLIVGWTMIVRGNIRAHSAAMVAAFAVSTVETAAMHARAVKMRRFIACSSSEKGRE